jgi:glyoxylase I family protein
MTDRPELQGLATRGIDHLAIVCDDLPAAMDFYTRVMGFQLVHVRRVSRERGSVRHYLFNMGGDSIFSLLEHPEGLPRQNREHVGGMHHVAFHVPPDRFDALIERVKAAGAEVIGPVAPGERWCSAYLFDPFGVRLEFATRRAGAGQGVIESVLQSEEEARAELQTLFSDPSEVRKWLAAMPLRNEPDTTARNKGAQ